MYLTAMTHRDELYDLTLRWLNDRFHPDDGSTVSRIFVYESAISAVAVEHMVILTTYEELMEAEFGCSIHELRVLRLRHRQTYAGPLGQNAEYLIEYLLALASSPTVSIPEIPIKMYGRYLPEAIATLKCALYGTDIDGGLLSTFYPEQDYLRHFRSTAAGERSVPGKDIGRQLASDPQKKY